MRLTLALVGIFALDAHDLGAQNRPKECSVDSVAVARLGGAAIYRDCDVDRPAKLRSAPKPTFRVTGDKPCLIATIELVVDSTGLVDTTSALVWETNSPEFADVVLKTLSRWRYSPAELGRQKVRQVVRERRAHQEERMITTRTVVTDQSGRVISSSRPTLAAATARPLCQ